VLRPRARYGTEERYRDSDDTSACMYVEMMMEHVLIDCVGVA